MAEHYTMMHEDCTSYSGESNTDIRDCQDYRGYMKNSDFDTVVEGFASRLEQWEGQQKIEVDLLGFLVSILCDDSGTMF